MRDPERIERVMKLLKQLWKKHPNQRLGQLLVNYVFANGLRSNKPMVRLFFQEDDVTEDILKKKLKHTKEKHRSES